MTLLAYDWREKAAATVADDYAVEKAFMDQAYAAVQNKCGPLMKPPHQIGFEIVHKNDSATRMVGIFGFKAGRQLFYAPVFFLNGEIKGTDLLYRHLTKSFVPLDEEWVIFLIANAKSDIGTGIDKAETRQIPVRLDLETLATPPLSGNQSGGSFKYAADEEISFDKEAMAERWEELIDSMEDQEQVLSGLKAAQVAGAGIKSPGLKDLILASGPDKGEDVVVKLASLMEECVEFQTEMIRSFEPSDYFPEELITMKQAAAEEALVKAAAAKGEDVTVLSIRTGGPAEESLFKHGFVIDDKRQETSLSVAYVEDCERLSQGCSPGKWSVLQPNGSFKDMLVFYDTDSYDIGHRVGGDDDPVCYPCGMSSYSDPSNRMIRLVEAGEGKNTATMRASTIYGNQLEDVKELMDSDAAKETMSEDKAYIAINPDDMTASRPFIVLKKSTRDGVTEYRIRTDGYDSERSIVVNPDGKKNLITDGMFNSEARFVEVGIKTNKANTSEHGPDWDVEFKKDLVTGNEDAVDSWLRTHAPTKEASVKVDGVTGEFDVFYDNEIRRGLSKIATAAVLSQGLQLPGATALELIQRAEASDDGYCPFTVWPKEAAQLQIRDQENFQSYMDPDFGIPVEPTQGHILETQWNGPEVPEQRVGDAWDPGMGKGPQNEDGIGQDNLMGMSPAEIAQMAESGETSAVFEHGVIGTLTNAFDANALVKEYIPKLEDAVDALGRTLFLFYWKPTDFEMTYGADDMNQMENQISSNFKSLGTLLLELLKRSKATPEGNQSASKG